MNGLAPALHPSYKIPVWFHHHGYKMSVKEFNQELRTLIIEGSAATLKIGPTKIPSSEGPPKRRWKLEWQVRQSLPEATNGIVLLTHEDLATAFGLNNSPIAEVDKWIIERYGGANAKQGRYIRWKEYLNIPCPGTGHDGDPNISILLDVDIHAAIASMLK